MPEITEVPLPGVGVRHEFTSGNGRRVSVVSHRSGRRDISVDRADDPDARATVLELDSDDAVALGTILGAPQLAASVTAMQQLEGLALDWLRVGPGVRAVESTIGESRYRTQTGASIVAVIRKQETIPAPGPEFVLRPGDVAVAVGTTESLGQLRTLLQS